MNILFPGRHHLLTDFQFKYLYRIVQNGLLEEPDVNGKPLGISQPVTRIVFATTSANHANTRRNPVPFYLRAMALLDFQQELEVPGFVFPIDDVGYLKDFASYTLKKIRHESEGMVDLTPQNTVVACSSPVLKMYEDLGFRILPVELADRKTEELSTHSPWDLVEMIAQTEGDWLRNREVFDHVHQASYLIWSRYRLGPKVQRLFSDNMLGADGDLTESRDYNSYVRQMDEIAELKFKETRPFIRPGRIGDIGCAVGTWLAYVSHDERFRESDLIGIEIAFRLYRICLQRKENGAFGNPNIFFAQKNAVAGLCFEPMSMHTIHTSSLTHEIESYGGHADLLAFIQNRYAELAPGGVWINRDVLGPDRPDEEIWLRLEEGDGRNYDWETPVQEGEALESYLNGLSTHARFLRFARDFRREEGYDFQFEWKEYESQQYAVLSLRDAMEFISKKDYTGNWQSEMHEMFCFWNYEDWMVALKEAGFHIAAGSSKYTNQWLVDNRYRGKADLFLMEEGKLKPREYPVTHMLMVAEKRL